MTTFSRLGLVALAVASSVIALGFAFPVEAAPGDALQNARTRSRIRRGSGEDIVLNHQASASVANNLVASLVSDVPMIDGLDLSRPGSALQNARTRSRIRRGSGEDIRF